MLILASASPRRHELLKLLVPSFDIVVPKIDERLLDDVMNPKDLSAEESRLKAYAIFSTHPNDEVLSCDTIVVLNGKALEKPKDYEDAFRMLKEESGKTQVVLSSYTYISSKKEITRTVASTITFNELSDSQIEEYIKNFRPFDKAGSYGIQDDFPLIKEIKGSYYNVMGLPIEDLKSHVFKR